MNENSWALWASIVTVVAFAFTVIGWLARPMLKVVGAALAKKVYSKEEREILVHAADSGEVYKLKTSVTGAWVRSGQNRDFYDHNDPAVSARYLEALEILLGRGLLNWEGGHLYRLTGSGFEVARKIKDETATESKVSTIVAELPSLHD